MKHLRSNAASNPQGIGPLFDSVKTKQIIEKQFNIALRKETGLKGKLATIDFDGVTYEPKFDATRLRGEMAHVYAMLKDRQWKTLREIARGPYSEAGCSARIRDLRKAKFGSHTVNRRRRGDPSRGIFEYQLL